MPSKSRAGTPSDFDHPLASTEPDMATQEPITQGPLQPRSVDSPVPPHADQPLPNSFPNQPSILDLRTVSEVKLEGSIADVAAPATSSSAQGLPRKASRNAFGIFDLGGGEPKTVQSSSDRDLRGKAEQPLSQPGDVLSESSIAIQRVPLNDSEETKRQKSSFRKSLVKMFDSFHASSGDPLGATGSGGASVRGDFILCGVDSKGAKRTVNQPISQVERSKSLKDPSATGKRRPMAERALTLIRAKSPPLPHGSQGSLQKSHTAHHPPHDSTDPTHSSSNSRPATPNANIVKPNPVRQSQLPVASTSKHFKSLSAPIVKHHEAASAGGGASNPSLVLLNSTDKDDEEDFERVYAVFVARFDTLRGNMIEYQYPVDSDLSGVEYQSLPSGSHAVMNDVIYFRKGHYYGICAFQRHVLTARDAEMQKERGARVRSVGILSTSFSGLHRHLPFLRSMANAFTVNLGEHDDLRTYFEARSIEIFPRVGLIESVGLPELQKDHPVSYFPKFIQIYGQNIFSLWKYVLLQKRVLFYGIPPVENLCYNIFCLNLLAANTIPIFQVPIRSQFFINVADIMELEHLKTFLACTTESIFGSKPQLWDLYVHHQDTSAQLLFTTALQKVDGAAEPAAPPKLTANEADAKRFLEITKIIDGGSNGKESSSVHGMGAIREEDGVLQRKSTEFESAADRDKKHRSKSPTALSTSPNDSSKFDVSSSMKSAFSLVQ
ncbi:hypothetical protein HDU97_005606 [Phlyctochytrium planicorne]|nr:hypothetical protein HDU97_005606 [Phlyctochytrium planicorne]